MEKDERQQLRAIVQQVASWRDLAATGVATRSTVIDAGDSARTELLARLAPASTSADWRSLSLTPADSSLTISMARAGTVPAIADVTQQTIDRLHGDVQRALDDVRALFGARRVFANRGRKDGASAAANYLTQFHEWVMSTGQDAALRYLAEWQPDPRVAPGPSAVLDDPVGLSQHLPADRVLIERSEMDRALEAIRVIDHALAQEAQFRGAVTGAADALRQAEARALVEQMPVERLKDASSGQLRISALTAAGIKSVQEVLDLGGRVYGIPSVGETTGKRMLGAARTIWQTTLDEMPIRLDIKNRPPAATTLLSKLAAWDSARSIKSATNVLAAADSLRPYLTAVSGAVTQVLFVGHRKPTQDLRVAMRLVCERAGALGAGGAWATDVWADFLSRPADYYAMLSELGFLSEDEEGAQGDLPEEILQAIRDLKLETRFLSASLRGYQSFGARFALVQRKVIIGDEMGLGKTVESLAVLTHLRAKGSHHFLVVCPAAVVTNWMREVTSKSDLRAHRLHGPGRDAALGSWGRNGGVAVTTYDTLGWLEGRVPSGTHPECLVFDEAHYIKNPDAQRTRRSRALIQQSSRAILLTGTPLENKIDEFRSLVGYLRPDLTVNASEFAPRQFRKQVAPAYLRRNQEDVLTELPELVEVDEWMPLSPEDQQHYRSAVLDSNFMAMRQAALRAGTASQKMQRLLDIVEEAEDNNRRVLVFSHFRAVLDDIAAHLPGKVFGPLTGSVPAARRQEMVDEFSQAPHGAVLVAQIVAGGVGLNIQSASVVVICEPQLKPTTEWQAIARSRRMGQLESVQVHRLLSEDGVDRRITEILARKRELFEEFARVSETADSAPEAIDISDAEIARDIVAAERQRLLSP
ncbi:DEAD/DEAH box helicase [Nocardioides ginkgobilobae]